MWHSKILEFDAKTALLKQVEYFISLCRMPWEPEKHLFNEWQKCK